MKSAHGTRERAPDFSGRDLNRDRISLEEEAEGAKYVLLDFWASWCGPCRQEYPHLRRLHAKYADQGLKIIGINLDTDRRKAQRAVKSAGLGYRHVYDGKGWRNAVATQYQVRAIPQTFLLDGELNLVAAGLRGAQLELVVPYLLKPGSETLLASMDRGASTLSHGATGTAAFEDAFSAAFEEMARAMSGEMPGREPGAGLDASSIDFKARRLDGGMLRLSEEAADAEYVLLDFWASWCGPCRAEFPYLRRLNDRYRDQGLKVIGVNLDQKKREAERAVKSAGLDYPHVFDGKGWKNAVAVQYNVRSIPRTVLLDKNLNVVDAGLRGSALEKRIGQLFGKGAGTFAAARRTGHTSSLGRLQKADSKTGDGELDLFLEDLKARNQRVRAKAVLEIGKLRGKADESIPDLVAMLKSDESYLVRSRAATALGSIGLRAEVAVPALVEALENDENPSARNAAARALKEFGPEAQEATSALTAALVDSHLSVRTSAADALAAIK